MEQSYFAPGKLVLCGEYAVLTPGGEGLASAIDVGVTAWLKPADRLTLSTPLLGGGPGELRWEGGQVLPVEPLDREAAHVFRFARCILEEVFASVTQSGLRVRPFELEIHPTGDPLGPHPLGGDKVGIGTSAATVVATGAAVLAHHGIDPTVPAGRDLLYRLAWSAHRRAQGERGSGIDVACSVYGGVLWFRQSLNGGIPEVRPVPWLPELRVLVGWTGQGVATEPRIAAVEALARENPRWIEQFVDNSRAWTRYIVHSLHHEEPAGVLRGLAMQRQLLLELGERAGLLMETGPLQALARAGGRLGVAKQSGAGGGDSGILVLRSPHFLQDAHSVLRASGLVPMAVNLPAPGVAATSMPRPSRTQLL